MSVPSRPLNLIILNPYLCMKVDDIIKIKLSEDKMKPHILIVEDDIVFCNLLKKFLSRKDLCVSTAQDLDTAKKEISTKKFDFIITDYRLPGASGLNLARWIKEKSFGVKFILMSRILDEDLIEEAKNLDILDFIKKPLNPSALLGVINKNL